MSKADRAKKRQQRRTYARPSMPRIIGANDNIAFANDNLPPAQISGVLLTPSQQIRFRDAELKCQSDDPILRKRGEQAFAALEQEVQARIEAGLVEVRLEKLEELESLRGHEVRRTKGSVRVSRDGLETLLTAGSINLIQHAAGMKYRADYELIDPERSLTPPALDQARLSGRGGDGFAVLKRMCEIRVRDLEAMIQGEDRTFRGALGTSEVQRLGRSVWVLREVAGKGHSLRSLSSSGSVIQSMSAALVVGLDCAAIAYGLS